MVCRTILTVSFQTHTGTRDLHAQFFLKAVQQLDQTGVLELDDTMAVKASKVMVLRRAHRFIMFTVVDGICIALDDKPYCLENSQIPVDSGQADRRIFLARFREDSLGIEVLGGAFDHLYYDLALGSDAATCCSDDSKRFRMSSHDISLSLLLLQIILKNFELNNPTIQVKDVIYKNARFHKPFCLLG